MTYQEQQTLPVLQYRAGDISTGQAPVVAELDLTVEIDGRDFVILLCTPRSLENLVAGFLFSEGLIGSRDDLRELTIDPAGKRARVVLQRPVAARLQGEFGRNLAGAPTTSGKGHTALSAAETIFLARPAEEDYTLQPASIPELMSRFEDRSRLFRHTGGVHGCALSDGRSLLLFEDDIGRHNAIDKVLGHALLNLIPLQDKIVLTSGRVSAEIIAKLARRRIPAIVSRSAPTSGAVERARALNMTLIGFARDDQFNLYSNFHCLGGNR